MTFAEDAFVYHPDLRGLITDPATSFFRDVDLAYLDEQARQAGFGPDWRLSDAERERKRRDALKERPGRDLWVFAYGSLMWDPGVYFEEIRRAHTADYARSFCLCEEMARGTRGAPGLMAGLDRGDGCTGVAFRVSHARLEEESFILFRRELIADAYRPEYIALETGQGAITAITFVAEHSSDYINADIPIEQQACMIASASGILGSSMDYLENLAAHLDQLGIEDAYVAKLLKLARARRKQA